MSKQLLIDRSRVTDTRRRQAFETAHSICKSYGKAKADFRAREIGIGHENESAGNLHFYALIRQFVRQALETGEIEGTRVAWK